MSSIIKVDTIQNQSGANIISESANTITVGASGDTVTIPSGGTLGGAGTFDLSSGSVTLNDTMKNTPSFSVRGSSTQTGVADNSITLVQLNSEYYDTDSAFDTSTYKFTVPSGKAGKYFFYGQVSIKGTSGADRRSMYVWLYKNGSGFSQSGYFLYDKHFEGSQENVPCIARTFDLSEGDTIELRAQCFDGSSGTYEILGNINTYLTGFKLVV